jgi:uncharacterized membrane protein YgcG
MHMTNTSKWFAAIGFAALGASSLGAQGTTIDPRWQAWIGCWAPAPDASGRTEIGGASRVCVVPSQPASAVEIVTVANGTVLDRARIDADGAPHTVSRDGCAGTESARWGDAGTRLYLSSELQCGGNVARSGRGVLSFTQRYEWLDVRGMRSKDASGVAARRYLPTDDATGVPADIRALAPARSAATNNAILAAAAPMTIGDIAEVGTAVDSGVAATWLMERTQGVKLSISGDQLASLADQGVPPAVIDIVVAIAHPDVFALNPASRDVMARDQGRRTAGTSAYDMYGRGVYGSPYYWGSPFGYYGWMPSAYGMYPYVGGYYGAYGYGYPYGYGYGYGSPYYGAYYPGTQPIVVVSQPGTSSAPSHGRVVRGDGYVGPQRASGGSSSGGSYSGGSSSSAGSSGSSGASSSGSSGSSGGGDRTAVKKP